MTLEKKHTTLDKSNTKKITYSQYFFIVFLIAFVGLFCVISIFRIIVGELVVRRLNIENSFTQFVLLDVDDEFIHSDVNRKDEANISTSEFPVKTEWNEIYPFTNSTETIECANANEEKEGMDSLNDSLKSRIEKYTSKYLPSYESFVFSYKGYEEKIGWNLDSYEAYNSVTILPDGYLGIMNKEIEVDDKVSAISDFADYCKMEGKEFIYIKTPDKINRYWDPDISDTIDFTSRNSEKFMTGLYNNDINIIDFDSIIVENKLTRYEVFYRTDHHWRAETGFWAANYILKYIKDNYGYDTNPDIVEEENFNKEIYEDYFLGSQGKKVTLERTEPDDFVLYYPKFDTLLKCYIPAFGIDDIGDFSLLYNMGCVDTKDYYYANPYSAYSYGDQPLMIIENENIKDNNLHVLLIHDSFCDCVIPFLALGCKRVDAIDLRHFDGSIETYIKEENPDIVMVAYAYCDGDIDYRYHNSIWDFR